MNAKVQEVNKLLFSLLLAIGLDFEMGFALLEILVLPRLRVNQLHWEIIVLVLTALVFGKHS